MGKLVCMILRSAPHSDLTSEENAKQESSVSTYVNEARVDVVEAFIAWRTGDTQLYAVALDCKGEKAKHRIGHS